MKAPKARRASPARPGPPDPLVRKDRLDHPARKVRRARLAPRALSARWEPVAASVRRDPAVLRGRLDRQEPPACMHWSETACDSKCELLCSAGEKLVSVTCPGGKIWIGRTAESETATCSDSPGPALALCIKR